MIPPLSLTAWLRFDAIRRALGSPLPARVLEVGAGQGAMGVWLAQRIAYTGFEPDARSRAVAAARLAAVGRGSVVDSPPDGTYDAVCAFEVLEHIEDDAAALAGWRDRLGERGLLVLSVPAHRRRYGPGDELVGHHRRYDRDELADLVAAAGFDLISIVSYGVGLGHVLGWVRDLVARRQLRALGPASTSPEERSAGSGRFLQARGAASLLLAALAVPFRLLQRPFAATELGVGWVLAARRAR